MSSTKLIGGTILSPHFIFIRCAGVYSDIELLEKLGIQGYVRLGSDAVEPLCSAKILFTEDREWTHIADDWWYQMWHMPQIRTAISEIARDHDVFNCRIPDCNDSCEFTYYQKGQIVRKYLVNDPNHRGGVVAENFGLPLAGEPLGMKVADQQTIFAIATSLGINLQHDHGRIRAYVKSWCDLETMTAEIFHQK